MDEVESLFPVPLLRVHRLIDGAFVEALAARVWEAHRRRNDRSHSLSHTEIVSPARDDLYGRLGRTIEPKLVDFGVLLFGDRLRWVVKEMWTNLLEPGGSQSLHAHANSFASGIVYLSPSHPSANTVFVRGVGAAEFSFRHNSKTAQVGQFNAGKWVTPEIEPGDMVLFPSYLLHEVPRNQGGRRLTLAFNAIPDRLDSWGYTIGFRP